MKPNLLLVSLLIPVLACEPMGVDGRDSAREYEDDIATLAPGRAADFPGGLVLTFTEVAEDSRCPVDATCVWEGNARVVLNADLAGVERVLALNTSPGEPTGPAAVSMDGYRIALLAVGPAPVAGQPIPPEAYRATVRVTY